MSKIGRLVVVTTEDYHGWQGRTGRVIAERERLLRTVQWDGRPSIELDGPYYRVKLDPFRDQLPEVAWFTETDVAFYPLDERRSDDYATYPYTNPDPSGE